MADTHDLGPFFWHLVAVKKRTPLFHRARSTEVDPPFRTARPVVTHVWPGKGLVTGKWKDSGYDEDEALLAALGLDGRGGYDMDVASPDHGRTLRLSGRHR